MATAAIRAIAIEGFTRQRVALENLATAINRARNAADRDRLFESHAGMALANAIYDLIEVDAVYDLAKEIGQQVGVEPSGETILYLEDREAGERDRVAS